MLARHALSEFSCSASETSSGPPRKRSRTSSSSSSVRPPGTGPSYKGSAHSDRSPGIPAARMMLVVQPPLATCRKRINPYTLVQSAHPMKSFDLPTMVESHSWTWLLDLGRYLNVAIDIVDDRCVPLLPIEGSDMSGEHAGLRALLSIESSPLRSTISIVTPSSAHAVAIDHQLCICHGLSPAGTLVVARTLKAGGAEDSRLELESIGIWLAAAIEGNLSNRAADAVADSHLVGSLRRLLDDAVARESTRGVVSAFVETLAVWLEIEVHGYVAGAPGRFLLSLSPVGADHSTVPAALDDDVVPAGTAMVRLSSSETDRFEFTSVPDDV